MKVKKAIKAYKPSRITILKDGEVLFAGEKKMLKGFLKSEGLMTLLSAGKEELKGFRESFYNSNIPDLSYKRTVLVSSFVLPRKYSAQNLQYDIYVIKLKLD